MVAPEALRPTVLVVDDTPDNLSLLSNLLKERCRIKVANNGLKALELAAAAPPDLVLLDIMMPEMDGYEVCRRLKANGTTRDVPVIFLTAKSEIEDEELGFSVGAADFIQKPISPPIVVARVKAHLEMKALYDSLQLRNQFIKKTFGRYMADEVVEQLLDSPDGLNLGGAAVTVTIVMADIRGFSAISETLPPETVVEMLNGYLSSMTKVIFQYAGVINEIIGDAILILFGAPSTRPGDADRAIACALAMQRAMEQVNLRNRELGLPELEMGIGINTGKVVAGNIGSDMRVKYAVVGSNVNLAARVESCTVGGQVLITESTLKASALRLTISGRIAVPFKGVGTPVDVYDVTGASGAYEISLAQPERAFAPLGRALPVSYEILNEKRSSGDARQGRILKLAGKSAMFCADADLEQLSNLKVVLDQDCGADGNRIFYAKVVSPGPDESNCYEMRFTYVPPGVRKFFDGIRASVHPEAQA